MTELCIRKSRRRCWLLLLLVLICYLIVMWSFQESQIHSVKIVQKILELDEVTPAPDRRFLIDLKDFDYIINQKSCSQLQMQPKFIILIHSAPAKRANRDNIRQTWGGWKVDHRVIFLLGKVASDDQQKEIQVESDFFKDIVQGNFMDSYKNLSYKHIMAMKWTTEFCPETKFIFKSDDDIFVNTPLLLNFVNRMNNRTNFIFCVISWKPGVIRDENSKWYVTHEEYPNETYPVYCPGCGVLLTTDVAQKLHKAAETTPFFWVDDVYVLGTLREKIHARITHIGSLHMGSLIANDIFANKRNLTDVDHFMFSFELRNERIKQLWEVVKVSLKKGYYNFDAIN